MTLLNKFENYPKNIHQSSPQRDAFRNAMRRVPGVLVLMLSLLIAGVDYVSAETRGVAIRAGSPKILTIGDSMLAWNRGSKRSISHSMVSALGSSVVDRSVIGARFNYALPISGAMGLNIAKQYRGENWEWVVLNGGGNDLWFGCGCVACDGTLNKLVSPTGSTGRIPELVLRIRSTGARVIYLGYLHSPGVGSLIDHCKDEGVELERRMAGFAARHQGVYFLPVSHLVPNGDRSFHSGDMIHPSAKASKIIGENVAKIIRNAKP